MSRVSASADYAKILVARFSSLGDIVLTTPVLMALRDRYPKAQIDYLLKEQYLPLLQNHPSNCGLIPLSEELRNDSGAYLKFCDSLRDKGYNLVVDLQGNGRSYVLRKRIYRDWVKVGKQTLKRILLVKFGIGRNKYPDIRRRFLKPLRDLGINDRKVPAKSILAVEESEIVMARKKFFVNDFKKNGSLVAIHTGSKWALKEWGLEKFIRLAIELLEDGTRVIWFGEPFDGASAEITFAKNTTLRELMALISISDVFVGNDSGPLHIAEGVGTPAVGIFGPTHPALGYSPDNPNSIVLGVDLKCRPCTLYGKSKCKHETRLCMDGIAVETVKEAVYSLLDKSKIVLKKAAFLDRDGTIIFDAHFLDNPDKIEIIPGAVEAVKILRNAGFEIVVLTNQSGIARGYFGSETVEKINARMVEMFAEKGAEISAVYYCPHFTGGSVPEFSVECSCRKPEPGMAIKAAGEHEIDLANSIVIGDKASDVQLAKNIGARGYLVRTGVGAQTEVEMPELSEFAFDNILQAAKFIEGKTDEG